MWNKFAWKFFQIQFCFWICSFLFLGLGGLGPCVDTKDFKKEDFCQRTIQDLENELSTAIEEISQDSQRRAPSAIEPREYKYDSKKNWSQWAKKNLGETQKLLDAIKKSEIDDNSRMISPEVINELSMQSVLWVDFYGFTKLGDLSKMALTLKKIQKSLQMIAKIFCK